MNQYSGILLTPRPSSTTALFEDDAFLVAARGTPYWICAGSSTVLYGLWATKYRDIRTPLAVGYALFTAGLGELEASQTIPAGG